MPGKPKYPQLGWIISALLLTAIAHFGTIQNGWVNWDDNFLILDNPLLHELSGEHIAAMFSRPQVEGAYLPLTLLSLAVDGARSGFDPTAFHATNFVLHLLNVLLVFVFFRLLTKETAIAGIVAILFGVHPMHLEAVAWITSRKDLLYSFFLLVSLIFYLFFLQKQRGRKAYYALSLLTFLFSLLSKGMAITFPLILLLVDYYEKRRDWRSLWLEKVPFFVLSGIFGILALKGQQTAGAMDELAGIPFEKSVFVGFYTMLLYVIKAVVPFRLSALHTFPVLENEALPAYMYAAVFLVVLAVVLIFRTSGSTRRILVFGTGFYVCAMLTVLQFIPYGMSLIAERFTYLGYAGLFYLFAEAFIAFPGFMMRKPNAASENPVRIPWWSWAFLVGIVMVFTGMTAKRTAVWENGGTLWSDVIQKYPDEFEAYWNRAEYYASVGKMDAAIADMDVYISLNPGSPKGYNNRAVYLMETGNHSAAVADLNQAIAIAPNLAWPYFNRGLALAELELHPDALQDFDRAIALDSSMADAWFHRSWQQSLSGNLDGALADAGMAEALGFELPPGYKQKLRENAVLADEHLPGDRVDSLRN